MWTVLGLIWPPRLLPLLGNSYLGFSCLVKPQNITYTIIILYDSYITLIKYHWNTCFTLGTRFCRMSSFRRTLTTSSTCSTRSLSAKTLSRRSNLHLDLRWFDFFPGNFSLCSMRCFTTDSAYSLSCSGFVDKWRYSFNTTAHVSIRYKTDPKSLKIQMNLLKDKSRQIQFCAFQVSKFLEVWKIFCKIFDQVRQFWKFVRYSFQAILTHRYSIYW